MVKLGKSGNGPKSWSAAKRRQKRPQTEEAQLSQEQNVGKAFIKRRSEGNRVGDRSEGTLKQPMKAHPKRKLQDTEKRLRALNKLLRQIEELQAKEQAGEELDEQQVRRNIGPHLIGPPHHRPPHRALNKLLRQPDHSAHDE